MVGTVRALRSLMLGLVLAVAALACAPDPPPVVPTTDPVVPTTDPVSPTTDPVSPTTDPVSPTTDPVSPTGGTASTTIPPEASQSPTTTRLGSASGECGVMLGMSQIRQAFDGSTLSGQGWMFHPAPGASLDDWAMPDGTMWESPQLVGECQDPRLASFGFDPEGGERPFEEKLDAVVDLIRQHYPTVEVVDVWLLVGADGHELCEVGGRVVHAAEAHAEFSDDLAAWSGDARLGPDLHVSCEGYADGRGHLNAAGAAEAGAQLDAWYGDG